MFMLHECNMKSKVQKWLLFSLCCTRASQKIMFMLLWCKPPCLHFSWISSTCRMHHFPFLILVCRNFCLTFFSGTKKLLCGRKENCFILLKWEKEKCLFGQSFFFWPVENLKRSHSLLPAKREEKKSGPNSWQTQMWLMFQLHKLFSYLQFAFLEDNCSENVSLQFISNLEGKENNSVSKQKLSCLKVHSRNWVAQSTRKTCHRSMF